jgi:hypothetical protein
MERLAALLRPCLRNAFIVLLLILPVSAAVAQFNNFSRITTPNGRSVLEVRMGTMPANRNLVFTAVITAGPVSGSTSLMLQQALAADIFNPSGPAAGWTVVRSSITAFSLGGGCGRNNLIDFPFINNNRPEILRITGTTQQVITLNISGNNDQYDSIDCTVNEAGQVAYILTNRTRQRLELRREQGGLLQLIRDDFGEVRTPFQGGARPSMRFARIRLATSPTPELFASKGDPEDYGSFSMFFYQRLVGPLLVSRGDLADPDTFVPMSTCELGSFPNVTTFGNVNESAVAGNGVIGDLSNANRFDLRMNLITGATCTPGPVVTKSSRAGGTLYTFAGVAAVASASGSGPPGAGVDSLTIVDTNNVSTFESGNRIDTAHPMTGRGGPKAACAVRGSQGEGGTLIAGPGASNTQLLQTIIPINYASVLFSGDNEDHWNANFVVCDQQ